jgi:hypothetical protein
LLLRSGLPAAVATCGLLNACYFYAQTYLILALTSLWGYTTTTAGLIVSAGSLSWVTGAWLQERLDGRGRGGADRSAPPAVDPQCSCHPG